MTGLNEPGSARLSLTWFDHLVDSIDAFYELFLGSLGQSHEPTGNIAFPSSQSPARIVLDVIGVHN
jgi:hypothetical protein